MFLFLTGCSSTTTVTSTLPPVTSEITVTQTIVPTVTETTLAPVVAINSTSTPINTVPMSIASKDGLESYLNSNFSKLETSLGPTNFTFDVTYNDSIGYPYDYVIRVGYDLSLVYDINYSNKVSTELANKVAGEWRDHQEKLARSVITLMPNTKLAGGYYWYTYDYPSIREGRHTYTYYSWANFSPSEWLTKYEDANIAEFVWTPDSLLWPGQKDSLLGR